MVVVQKKQNRCGSRSSPRVPVTNSGSPFILAHKKRQTELGNVEIIWRGPVVESDTGSQIEVVKNMITMQVDGIVLAPNQKGGLVDAVDESIGEGIPVVIFDSGLDEGPEIVSYVATDNYKGGQMAAKQMATAIGDKGNVILLRYIAGSESTEQREAGFPGWAQGLPKHQSGFFGPARWRQHHLIQGKGRSAFANLRR